MRNVKSVVECKYVCMSQMFEKLYKFILNGGLLLNFVFKLAYFFLCTVTKIVYGRLGSIPGPKY